MNDITAPLIVAIAVGAYVIGLAMNYVAGRVEKRQPEPYQEPAAGYPDCFGCALAADTSEEWLAWHLRRDHREKAA